MTTQEKIEVMEGFVEGKKIQWRPKFDIKWDDCVYGPDWNWNMNDYRIKPEEKYRPYKDTNELKADFFKDCPQMSKRYRMAIWVVMPNGTELEITGFSGNGEYALINGEYYSMEDLFKDFKYPDGSPFGIRED